LLQGGDVSATEIAALTPSSAERLSIRHALSQWSDADMLIDRVDKVQASESTQYTDALAFSQGSGRLFEGCFSVGY